jgi:hypothetical protein
MQQTLAAVTLRETYSLAHPSPGAALGAPHRAGARPRTRRRRRPSAAGQRRRAPPAPPRCWPERRHPRGPGRCCWPRTSATRRAPQPGALPRAPGRTPLEGRPRARSERLPAAPRPPMGRRRRALGPQQPHLGSALIDQWMRFGGRAAAARHTHACRRARRTRLQSACGCALNGHAPQQPQLPRLPQQRTPAASSVCTWPSALAPFLARCLLFLISAAGGFRRCLWPLQPQGQKPHPPRGPAPLFHEGPRARRVRASFPPRGAPCAPPAPRAPP